MTHPLSLSDWLKIARLKIDALDARLLAQHVLDLSRAELICQPDFFMTPAQREALDVLLARRVKGEPLPYLTGEARFRGRSFNVTPAVLVPRPETEDLVGHAINALAEFPAADVLDLGCGSGVIAISIALECHSAKVTGVDLSLATLDIARANAATLAAPVEFLQSDWFSALAGRRFHLVVANPPYVATDDPRLADDGLLFEPRLALTGENDDLDDSGSLDGLSCLRRIAHDAPFYLEQNGCLLFEHGHEQGEAVRHFLADAGFAAVRSWRDLSGNERFSGGKIVHPALQGDSSKTTPNP